MAKFASVFVLFAAIAVVCSTPVVRRDVSELSKQKFILPPPDRRVFGNGIRGADAEIVQEHYQRDPIGNYDFGYKQNDLQEREEIGTVAKDPKTGNFTLDNVVGFYKYVRPDGLWQIVEYRADRNGFVPHIRTEPYIEGGPSPVVRPLKQ